METPSERLNRWLRVFGACMIAAGIVIAWLGPPVTDSSPNFPSTPDPQTIFFTRLGWGLIAIGTVAVLIRLCRWINEYLRRGE